MPKKFLKQLFSRPFRNHSSDGVQPATHHREVEGEGSVVPPIVGVVEIIPSCGRMIKTRDRLQPFDSGESCGMRVDFRLKTSQRSEPAQVIAGDFRIRECRFIMFVQPAGYRAPVPARTDAYLGVE